MLQSIEWWNISNIYMVCKLFHVVIILLFGRCELLVTTQHWKTPFKLYRHKIWETKTDENKQRQRTALLHCTPDIGMEGEEFTQYFNKIVGLTSHLASELRIHDEPLSESGCVLEKKTAIPSFFLAPTPTLQFPNAGHKRQSCHPSFCFYFSARTVNLKVHRSWVYLKSWFLH